MDEVKHTMLIAVVLVTLSAVIGLSITAFMLTSSTANDGADMYANIQTVIKDSSYSSYIGDVVTGNVVVQITEELRSKNMAVLIELRNPDSAFGDSAYSVALKVNDVNKYLINYGYLVSMLDNHKPTEIYQGEWGYWTKIDLTMRDGKVDAKFYEDENGKFVSALNRNYGDKSLPESILPSTKYICSYLYNQNNEIMGLIFLIYDE